MAKEKLGAFYHFCHVSMLWSTVKEAQVPKERWPCRFTGGFISLPVWSSRCHFNTHTTFLAKHVLGNVEISPVEEEEEKLVVMGELEQVLQELGTTTTAVPTAWFVCHLLSLTSCHLTAPVYNLSSSCNRFWGINNTKMLGCLPLWRDNKIPGARKWAAVLKNGGEDAGSGDGLGF